LVLNLACSNVPNHRKVIITTWGQAASIVFQSTNLTSVSFELKHNVVRRPDIMAEDFAVSGASKQKAVSKGRWGDTRSVAFEGPD
jgi:hypothetical protein